MHNGSCANQSTTITICPVATYKEWSYASPDACYNGNVLQDLEYESNIAVPVDVSIEAWFTYRSLSALSPCTYRSNTKTNTYTISAGNKVSDPIKTNIDVLHVNNSAWAYDKGWSAYFDTDFTSLLRRESATVDGQLYEFVLWTDCSAPTVVPQDPECWDAAGWTYSVAPDLDLLCDIWDYTLPKRSGVLWTRTCSNDAGSTDCTANYGFTPDPDLPLCGTSLTNKCRVWTETNVDGNSWSCVNGTQKVCCEYGSLPKTTYSCPVWYRLTSDNRCELYAQFCVDDIICKGSNPPLWCTNTTTYVNEEGCGSVWCFWDTTQKADWDVCDRGRAVIEYSESKSQQYGLNSIVWWSSIPGGEYTRWYKITEYTSWKNKDNCDTSAYSLEQIVKRCGNLYPWPWGQDNGFIIDGSHCSAVPQYVDACTQTTETWGVQSVACLIWNCNEVCNQCYDTFGECKSNKPDSATSDCELWTPNSAVEEQCYCYRPAATVPVCWYA